jgi:hypothetical protein
MEVPTPAGLLRVTFPQMEVVDGLDLVSSVTVAEPWATLNGKPVSMDGAREILAAMRSAAGHPMNAPSNYQGKATITVTLDTGYEYTLAPVPYHGDTPEEAAKRAIAFAGRIMLKDEVTH